MSFKIGQIRRNQLSYPSDYQIEKDIKGTVPTILPIDGFNEGAFPYSFEEGKTYYINLEVNLSESLKEASAVYIKLYSKGENGKKGKEMTIRRLSSSSYLYNQEIIFTPNRNYNYLVVQIDRRGANSQSNAYYQIKFKKLWELKNILTVANFKNKFPNIETIKSLGIQGPTGMIFALNGEEFKIGKSGVCTVSDAEINSICFFLKSTGQNNRFPFYNGETQEFFIMDFEY